MDVLLLAFALPVATILLSIVLQKVLRCPLLVAATFLAILLIVTFAFFDSSFLVFAILYTILAYVTAVLTRLICNLIARFNLNNSSPSCVCCNENNRVIVLANTDQARNNVRSIGDEEYMRDIRAGEYIRNMRELRETRETSDMRNRRSSCNCRYN